MKAGLMEVADIFVLNKAEREGADRLEQQLHAMLELAPHAPNSNDGGRGGKPPIVRAAATEGKSIHALADAIDKFSEQREPSGARRANILQHCKHRFLLP